MKHRLQFATLIIFLSFALSSCSSLAPGEIPPGKEGLAALDKPFKLKYDEAMLLPDANIWVRFAAVKSDSRCPKDVQCVQAGEAQIILAISLNDKDAVFIELATTLERASVALEGYRVLLQAVEPYPESTTSISQDEYIVTIVISR